MEFEEMKKVWNTQNSEMLYVINEKAVHRSITSKRKTTTKIIDKNEIGLIIIYTSVGLFLLTDAIYHKEDFWDYLLSGWMLASAISALLSRRNRKKEVVQYDRSMLGEIDHAIENAKATIRLAYRLINWYILPFGLLMMTKMAFIGASVEKWFFIAGTIILAYLLANWENKKCHQPRLLKLEKIRTKLMEESQK